MKEIQKEHKSKEIQLTLDNFKRSTQIQDHFNQKKIDKQIQQKQTIKQVRQQNSDLSVKTIKLQNTLYNVQFYIGKIPSKPNGDYIYKIHENWSQNFTLLQEHHGYIQWIFPNTFQSRFNPLSHPISSQQIQSFITNQMVYNRYVRSYQMMLNFYGIKLIKKTTGQLMTNRKNYIQRFQKTLLTRFHNHMRITRILSSLRLLGFSRQAIQLAKFLKRQIYAGDLRGLKSLDIYERQWKQFEQLDIKKQRESQFFIEKKKRLSKPALIVAQ